MNTVRKIVTYEHEFLYKGERGAGFGFPCEKDGTPTNDNEASKENYRLCLTGVVRGREVTDMGIKELVIEIPLCMCGSGKDRYPLEDARGIFCCNVCDDCIEEKKKSYRSDIFTDSNYVTNEEI